MMPTPRGLVRNNTSPGWAAAFFWSWSNGTPRHRQAKDGLRTIDAVAAGQRDAGLLANASAALQNLATRPLR